MPSANSLPTSELWKERLRAPTTAGAQIAALAPTRGIAVSNRSGVSQVYAWDVPSGEMRPLTDKPGGVSFGLLSPDGRWFYYMDDTKGSEIGQYVRVPYDGGPTENVTPSLPPYSASAIPFPQPSLAFSASGNAFLFRFNNADGYNLCRVEIGAGDVLGAPEVLYTTSSLFRAPIVSEDGAISVVASSERTGKQRYELFAFDTNGRRIAELADGGESSLESIAFSPIAGDKRLAANSDKTGERRPLLWNPVTGERRDLWLPDMDGEVLPVNWSPDGKRLLLCQFHRAVQQLYLYDLETDSVTRLDHPSSAFTLYGSYGVSFGPEGREIFVQWNDAQNPTRLIALDCETGRQTQIVLMPAEAPSGRPVRSVDFPSSDGTLVQGWLCVPEGDGPFPTILHVHGGPHDVTTQVFGMGSVWAENGFAWLSVNYRGTPTFGRDYLQKIWGDAGHWELEDMVAGRDFLVGQGIARPDKVLVSGGSYGGYLTLLALGKRPGLWAGGMGLVAVADWALTWEDSSGLLKGITTASFGGTPFEKPDLYRAASPLTYAEDVRAPLLVIQGKNDTRCPPRQMEVYEAKMRELGKEMDIVWFDAGHGSGDREEVIRWYEKMLAFARRVTASAS